MTRAHRTLLVLLLTGLAGCSEGAAPVELPDIHGLAVDSDDPSVLYVATHNGLFRAHSDGDWAAVTENPFDMMGFTRDASDGTMYASGHPAMGGLLGFARSQDRGVTWTVVSLHGQVDFHAMTASLAQPGRVWGYWGGEMLRSDDGGTSWTNFPLTPPLRVLALASHATDPDVVFAGATDGIHVSRDGGQTFQSLVDTAASPVPAIATTPADPALVVAHASDELWTTRDGGQNWTQSPLAFPAGDAGAAIALHPDDAGTWYVASYRGLIRKTTDAGETWQVVR